MHEDYLVFEDHVQIEDIFKCSLPSDQGLLGIGCLVIDWFRTPVLVKRPCKENPEKAYTLCYPFDGIETRFTAENELVKCNGKCLHDPYYCRPYHMCDQFKYRSE